MPSEVPSRPIVNATVLGMNMSIRELLHEFFDRSTGNDLDTATRVSCDLSVHKTFKDEVHALENVFVKQVEELRSFEASK